MAWEIVRHGAPPDTSKFFIFALALFPLALLACWLLGGPILSDLMRNPVSWRGAVASGAMVAATMALLAGLLVGSISLSGNVGLSQSNEAFLSGGLPTSEGWRSAASYLVFFIALGSVVGLLVRLIIGPGRTGK
ncbi:hypothetical protein [Tabrizicola sp.]|uniref:hypothetical protein n=1 Tax=Tabrizicola sp. TaxID=2005166 RepID=UPI002FDEE40C